MPGQRVHPSVSEASGHQRFVPYDRPYENQQEAMDRIATALDAGRDVLFEGATGTGKTLAALAPALAQAQATDRTVVITTNVHQQMRQFRREAAAIAETEDVHAVVFRGKSAMCHIGVDHRACQTLREATSGLVDAEREIATLERRQRELLERMQTGDDDAAAGRQAVMDELESAEQEVTELRERPTCEHYYRNLTADSGAFSEWLEADVRRPDEIYEYADERGLCGYELLKAGMDDVDLVVCNYHHLLDPAIREQFLRWLGRDASDVIAVFDEAHNLADVAREHARRTLTETTLEGALDECADSDDPRAAAAANVLTAFRAGLSEAYDTALDFGEREQVGTEWHDLAIANDDRRDELTLAFLRAYNGPGIEQDLAAARELGDDLEAAYAQAYRRGEVTDRRESPTRQAAAFVETWLTEHPDPERYPVVSVRTREDGDIYGRAELYTCIPKTVTRTLFEDLAASVLMSATLRPFDVTESILGIEDPMTLAYGQPFPPDRRRTIAVDGPALFASRRDDPDVQNVVTSVLNEAVQYTPGNTLAFFPSYTEAARYHDRVDVDGPVYLDEAGTPAQDLRRDFVADDDALLCSSLWGTLGEGVSYDGDDARSVVVVGVPYPHLDERRVAVQEAYEGAFGNGGDGIGWRYAVQIPTIRKTRQALGRVVRSPEDFGARIVLDARYTERATVEMSEYAVRSAFPPEERAEIVDVTPDKLRYALFNFFADLEAYGADAPRP